MFTAGIFNWVSIILLSKPKLTFEPPNTIILGSLIASNSLCLSGNAAKILDCATLSFIKNNQMNQFNYLLVNFTNKQTSKKIFIKQQLPEYDNVVNFYDAKQKKHTAVFVKKN